MTTAARGVFCAESGPSAFLRFIFAARARSHCSGLTMFHHAAKKVRPSRACPMSRRRADIHTSPATLADKTQHSGCALRRSDLHQRATRRLHMSDRIEKTIELKAPVSRVWKALTDHHEFGKWFKVRLEGPFAPSQVSRGHITHPGYEHGTWQAVVQKMDPERLLSFTPHPYAIGPKQDYNGA